MKVFEEYAARYYAPSGEGAAIRKRAEHAGVRPELPVSEADYWEALQLAIWERWRAAQAIAEGGHYGTTDATREVARPARHAAGLEADIMRLALRGLAAEAKED